MNDIILQALLYTSEVLNDARQKNQNVVCNISGGADSDILIDMCEKTIPHFVSYVFFDTGIEYQATKEHLKYLESKYNIKIDKANATVPVPLGNKKYGVPFLSKRISEMIQRLQRHNFQWEDDSFENLIKKYPKCMSALKWWTNYDDSQWFGIMRNPWLKEFIIKNPPDFKISPKCCDGAKKNTAHNYQKLHGSDLVILGIRTAEGGARATAYSSQLYYNKHQKVNYFFPILYFSDSDRREYEEEYNITHSRCYTEYGLQRTGCAGCPFGKNYQSELAILKDKEPKLYNAIINMWGSCF